MFKYKDRKEAGKLLAKLLMQYKEEKNTIIFALPRGGVPIAFEISQALNIQMDIFIVRKLGVPWQEELAMGAIAGNEICIFNNEVINGIQIEESEIQAVINKEKKELARRNQLYRAGRSLPDLTNQHVILVDDGIATGASMQAAILALKKMQAKKITLAIPVAPLSTIYQLEKLVDEVVCPQKPEPFYSVGTWYENFPQVTDKEVLELIDLNKNML